MDFSPKCSTNLKQTKGRYNGDSCTVDNGSKSYNLAPFYTKTFKYISVKFQIYFKVQLLQFYMLKVSMHTDNSHL